jgi:diaminohydroxyphosphoribosylaminopyrimidine deaminase/5-amino-6-(5-phosphoribosylamino)uracil reductase
MIYDPKGRLRGANPKQKERLMRRLFQGETVFWGINQSLNFTSEDRWIVDQDRLVVVPLTEKNATFVDFLDLVTELFPSYHDGKPLQSLLVEGGPTLLTSLLEGDALDLVHVFVNPSLVGGQKHRIGSKINQRSKGIETNFLGRSIRERLQFRSISLNQLGQDLVWDMIPESRFEKLWQPMMGSNSSMVEAFS